ncbi:hypothetical protein [Pedobacter nototheniae]|uniref:hypothetical protein n=1 Tax=Pedobacter nototheniae TaxID=2488994 RepID=UPI0018EC4E80|nr:MULTISPECIES: hypothetical protein [Pedobacter]
MKRYNLLILLFVGIFFSACKKDKIVSANDYEKSYKTWLNFKVASNNSYRYQVNTNSWTGYSTETTITVQNGAIVKRAYVAKAIDPKTHAIVVVKEWIEDKTSLNTHQDGALTRTLDDIYDEAKSNWLIKRKDAKTSFEAKNNGMISSCGYVENGCQDDCFNGIYISLIEKI